VLAYTTGRLTRRPREHEDLIELAEEHGLRFEYVRSPSFDLNTAAGRRVARILAANDAGESEDISERLVRQRLQAAAAGQVHGSPRPFGYEADLVTVRESEAAIVRECAVRVLAGESLHSLARDLADRGILTARGNPWARKSLRHMLVSARISGRREHRPVADYVNGNRPLLGQITADAVWPAIITAEDSDRLRQLLTRPERSNGPKARSYLLSGILRCHSCGHGLVGRPAHGKRRDVCDKKPGSTACGTISVTADFADDVVRDMVLVALESDVFRDRLYACAEVDPGIRAAVVVDERRLVELAEEWADGGLTRGEWRAARERIEARLDGNRANPGAKYRNDTAGRHDRHARGPAGAVGLPGTSRSAERSSRPCSPPSPSAPRKGANTRSHDSSQPGGCDVDHMRLPPGVGSRGVSLPRQRAAETGLGEHSGDRASSGTGY
jgi:hypothetical protein